MSWTSSSLHVLPGEILTAGYPVEHVCDVALADGTVATIRPVRPADAADLIGFHAELSPETVYRRFMGAHPHLSPGEASYFTHVDYHDRMALVAHVRGQLVAVGRYDRKPGTATAEVAFVVADGLQHLGLGTLLLEHLAGAARRRSISTFYAEILGSNQPMLEVLQQCGLATDTHWQAGEAEVVLALEPTDGYARAVLDRSLRADHQSMERLLSSGPPQLGLSPRDGRDAGHRVLVATDRVVSNTAAAHPRRGRLTVGEHHLGPESVSPGLAIATDESGDIDACDALAYLAVNDDIDAVIAEVTHVRRPHTFVATAWAALRLAAVAVRSADPELCALLVAAGIPAPDRPATRVPITAVCGLLDSSLVDDPLVPRLGKLSVGPNDGGQP